MRKKWYFIWLILNWKLLCCWEFLGKYLFLYSCNILLSVYKNVSYRGYCVILNLCNDIEINFGFFIYGIDFILIIKVLYSWGDIMYFGENVGK